MYCDYEALKDYANILNKNFNTINNAIINFESALQTAMSLNSWDSPTRDYIFGLYNSLKVNFEVISNKFNNINLYLDSVINNYKFAEQQMASFF